RIVVVEELLRGSAERVDLLARVSSRSPIILRSGRHTEPGSPPFADPQLLAAGKSRDVAVHDSTDAPGKTPYRRMRLFNQFLRRNVAQRAVQRIMDACKRVHQDIVRDHEGILASLCLLLSWSQDFRQSIDLFSVTCRFIQNAADA